MGSFAVFFLYLAGAYGLMAVLSVPLSGVIVDVPPHKLIGRGGLLLALAGFWWFLRALRLDSRRELGYWLPAGRFARDMGAGLVLGILILACLSAALMLLEIREVNGPRFRPWLPKVLLQGLLGGLAVAFIEETFFRGAMFSAIRRRGGGVAAALLLTSLLYAALHFFKPQLTSTGPEYGLAEAMATYLSAYTHLFRPEHLDSFAALFLVGLFLALVRLRSGHIAWGIGLHAGWVLVIKLTHAYTHYDPGADLGYLVGGYDRLIGWLAVGWIGLLSLALAFWALPQPGAASGNSR